MSYYKCPSYDNTILNFPTIEAPISGSIVTFNTSIATQLFGLKVGIIAQQASGTPTPQSPLAITGWDKVNVMRAGKNLLAKPFIYNDNDNLDSLSECFFIKAGNYVASFSEMTNATNWRFIIRLKDANGNNLNTTDYVTFNTGFQWSATRKAWINGANTTTHSCIFTLNQDCYIRILFGVGNTSSSSVASNAQLEIGSTRTDYEPYNPQSDTFTLSLGQTVYGGYVDWKNGKLVLTHILLGAQTWTKNISGYSTFYCTPSEVPKYISNTQFDYICSHYECMSVTATTSTGDNYIYVNNQNRVTVKDTSCASMTETEFAEHMADVQFVYLLATPTEISLPVPMPSTITGEQNWFADTGNILELQYIETVQEYLNKHNMI